MHVAVVLTSLKLLSNGDYCSTCVRDEGAVKSENCGVVCPSKRYPMDYGSKTIHPEEITRKKCQDFEVENSKDEESDNLLPL